MKLFEKIKIHTNLQKEKEIRILNIPVIQYGRKEEYGVKEKYFSMFPSESFKTRIFSRIFKELEMQKIEFDHIYLCRLNMGEAYVLACIIKEWIKVNNSQKPVVIITQKYHSDIFNMFCPEIPYVFVPISKLEMDKTIFNVENTYRGKKILYWLPMQNCAALSANIKNQNGHFFDMLCQYAKVDKKCISPQQVKNFCDIKNIADKLNVNLENFILLTPEAISLVPLSSSFWQNLTFELKKLGFDVLYNCKHIENIPKDAKHCFLTIPETYELAQHTKALISLRSGLNDVLSTIQTKQFIIYTALSYHSIDTAHTLSGYSLEKMPGVNKQRIQEFNYDLLSENELIEQIINEIQSGKTS